jgi:hypothetical protein
MGVPPVRHRYSAYTHTSHAAGRVVVSIHPSPDGAVGKGPRVSIRLLDDLASSLGRWKEVAEWPEVDVQVLWAEPEVLS